METSDEKQEGQESLIRGIDTFVHEPVRLGVLLLLQIHTQLPFSQIQHILNVTSGNLNSHLTRLEEKGYVELMKGFVDLRPRTIIKITSEGTNAILSYIKHFKSVIKQIE